MAHRLGLNAIKTELEDLSLKHTQPDKYHAIADGLQSKKAQRKKLIANFIEPVKEKLNKIGGIEFVITGRPKSIYSIYKKMVKQGVNINEVYDLLAVRIILKQSQCQQSTRAYFVLESICHHHRYVCAKPKNDTETG